MNVTHRIDSGRTGSVTASTGPDGQPLLVVQHDDSRGKRRKRTFKSKSKYGGAASVWSNALRFLFKEGFIAPAPQMGPLCWLTVTHEPYPHGFAFDVDRTGGFVWLADTGYLRRVTRGTCEQLDISVGDDVMARDIACNASGQVCALLDIEQGGATGSPPWRAPSKGKFAYGLVRVTADHQVQVVATIPQPTPSTLMNALSLSDDGLMLGPHPDGAGLYAPDGTVLDSWGAAPTNHHPPKGALSANGRWVVLTHDHGAVRIVDRQGEERIIEAGFSQVHDLQISDVGVVHVRGFGPDDWALYAIDDIGTVTPMTRDIYGEPTPDGQSIVEVAYGRVALHPATADPMAREATHATEIPMLGMAKKGRARFIDPDHVIIQTDAHTLAEIDVRRLRPS